MDEFLQLSSENQQAYLQKAYETLNLPAATIEKDFWVTWTLRELFQLKGWGEHLTFKGGTSLSKAWDLIDRFSEDIDIVIDRDFLGFGGANSPEQATSRKQREKRLKSLKAECHERIRNNLQPTFRRCLEVALPPKSSWSLMMASVEEDADQQTLLFRYPGVAAKDAAYLNPVVRIELGARSDTEPNQSPTLRPLLSKVFPQLFSTSDFAVRTVAPRRTFWEKAMLLHEESFRPADRKQKARLARHYYDLWSLIMKGVGDEARHDLVLFNEIVAHRRVFFEHTWLDYSTLQPGSLRLVPPDDRVSIWRSDYQSMRGEMFFGNPPTFDEILKVVGGFERDFNQGA
jgi:hypothetical protein